MTLRDLICGPWKRKYENSQRRVTQLEGLLSAQVRLTEGALKVGDGERILKTHYKSQVDAAVALLDKAIKVPLYTDYGKNGVPIDLFDFDGFGVILREITDETYLTFTQSDWTTMLSGLYDTIKETLGRWRTEIWDCDNFALIFQGLFSLMCRDSGFPSQGAFAWARSPTHGYNVYIDTEGVVWVFEPQSGQTVGRLGETEKPYDTIRVYFTS